MAIIPFTPSRKSAPSFLPTLDGRQYFCTVTWNIYGQRYYLNCFTLTGRVPVFSVALVETPAALEIDQIVYDDDAMTATITTAAPHGFPIAQTVRLTVAGAIPDAYNGEFLMMSTGDSTLLYDMAVNPLGPSTTPGTVSFLTDMARGYFTSTVVFRNQAFEISP